MHKLDMHKKVGLLAAMMALGFLGARGAEWWSSPRAPAAASPGRLEVSPKVLDLGTLDEADPKPLEGRIRVKNAGDKPLFVHGVNSSCGCTVVDFKPQSIGANESLEILARVEPKNEAGIQGSVVTLLTSDRSNPSFDVKVRWFERPLLSTDQKLLDFGILRPGQSRAIVLRLAVSPNVLFSKPSATSGDGGAITFNWGERVPGESDADPDNYDLEITCKPLVDDFGEHTREVFITSEDTRLNLRIPARWVLSPPVEAIPRAIFLPNIRAGSRVVNSIILSALDKERPSVVSVALDGVPMPFEVHDVDDSYSGPRKSDHLVSYP